jgi:hypothetical protein
MEYFSGGTNSLEVSIERSLSVPAEGLLSLGLVVGGCFGEHANANVRMLFSVLI